MTPTKVNPKHSLRKSRLEVLAEIDRLEKLRCDFCHLDAGFSPVEKSRCGCDAAVAIRKLGIRLNKLLSPRRDEDCEVLPPLNMDGLTIETITPELYKAMKLRKMTDTQIFKHLRIGGVRFNKWKKENGVGKKTKEE